LETITDEVKASIINCGIVFVIQIWLATRNSPKVPKFCEAARSLLGTKMLLICTKKSNRCLIAMKWKFNKHFIQSDETYDSGTSPSTPSSFKHLIQPSVAPLRTTNSIPTRTDISDDPGNPSKSYITLTFCCSVSSDRAALGGGGGGAGTDPTDGSDFATGTAADAAVSDSIDCRFLSGDAVTGLLVYFSPIFGASGAGLPSIVATKASN
jgi:hypothetical protein